MSTKYPILLVHGIALKDFMFFKAFGKIEEILRKEGHRVYTSRIDGFGTTLKKSTDDFVMGIPLIFSHYYEDKVSDGLVSADSSQFWKLPRRLYQCFCVPLGNCRFHGKEKQAGEKFLPFIRICATSLLKKDLI